MTRLFSLGQKLLRTAKLAPSNQLQSLHFGKLQSTPWLLHFLRKNNKWSWSNKSHRKTNTSNRHPNLVIRQSPPTNKFTCGTILGFLPLNETWQQSFNMTRLSKSLPIKNSFCKCQMSLPKHKMNVPSEKSRNGPRLARCRITTNLPGFSTSTMPERGQRHSFPKHRKSMLNTAQPWHKKNSSSIAFSKKFAPTMTWQSAKTDQSQNSSL